MELRDKDFVPGVRAILTETGLAPHCLELELTETFPMTESGRPRSRYKCTNTRTSPSTCFAGTATTSLPMR